jgi:hypothetical protein
VSSALFRLVATLARRHGRTAVAMLVVTGRAWLADPNNDRKRAALVAQLRIWSAKTGEGAARTAGRLAGQIERRRMTIGAWERELMNLRYEIVELPPGAVREAALDAYAIHAAAAGRLVAGATRPSTARRKALAALHAEEAMLRGDPLSDLERTRAIEAVERARVACYRAIGPDPA